MMDGTGAVKVEMSGMKGFGTWEGGINLRELEAGEVLESLGVRRNRGGVRRFHPGMIEACLIFLYFRLFCLTSYYFRVHVDV